MTTNVIPVAATSGLGALATANNAAGVPVTPAGGIAATDAQAALAEVDAEHEVLGQFAAMNVQAGAAYTLVLTDKGKLVRMDNAGANTVTIPPNATAAFPLNSEVRLLQYGAGQTSIVAGVGVTIRSPGSFQKVAARYGQVVMSKIAVDEWVLAGALAA